MQRGSSPSDRIIAEAAWLYYIKNLTQGEIAARLGLSRPTVISYLKQAKERQIVSVRLTGDHLRINDLAEGLMERFGIEAAYVVPENDLGAAMVMHEVCVAAGQILADFLEAGDQLGVSWGRTVSDVAENMPYWPVADLTVRQLIGSMANPLLPTSERCSTEIAHRLSALCINLNAPAVCSSSALAEMLRSEAIIAQQLDLLGQCNKAIYSVSPCTPDTHVVKFKIATEGDVADYRRNGAVGIIAGRFVDAQGGAVLGPLDGRLIGADHRALRGMKGLLVVTGMDKLHAATAALRGGYVCRLVLDAPLAAAILAAAG
ncbi:MAG TPA: sugar-binding domain-containing protein [Paenirhodobacter sp.]